MPFVIWSAKPLNNKELITPDVLLPGMGISYRVLSSVGDVANGGSVLAEVSDVPALDGFVIAEASELEAREFIASNFVPSDGSTLTAEEVAELTINPPAPSQEELDSITPGA